MDIKKEFTKLGLVEEVGNELARAGHVNAVVCKRVRKADT